MCIRVYMRAYMCARFMYSDSRCGEVGSGYYYFIVGVLNARGVEQGLEREGAA